MLTEKPKRIALQKERAAGGLDLVLVVRAFLHPRDENFPDAAPEQLAHRVDAAIPEIEIADHADAAGIRRPDREINSALAADLAQMRAKLVVKLLVISLREQVAIDLAHDRPVAVGIAQELLRAVKRNHLHEVGKIGRFVRHSRLVKPLDMEPLGRENLLLVFRRHDLDLLRLRAKNAHDQVIARLMRTEDLERIGMGSMQKGGDLVRVDGMDGK